LEALRKVILTRERPQDARDVERWQMLGMHSMRHFQANRYDRAVEKDLQQQIDKLNDASNMSDYDDRRSVAPFDDRSSIGL